MVSTVTCFIEDELACGAVCKN